MSNYPYPIDPDWTTDELITVVNFLTLVEKAYDGGVSRDEFSLQYQKFKQIVDSISAEKQMDKKFKDVSGYSIYQVVKEWKNNPHCTKLCVK